LRVVAGIQKWKGVKSDMPCSGYCMSIHTDISMAITEECMGEDTH